MSKQKRENQPENLDKKNLPDLIETLPERLKPLILSLPEEEREKAAAIVLSEVITISKSSSTTFSGPLPHPDILNGYENVITGSAERILSMAENQSKHRQEIEKTVVQSQMKQSERGQQYGLGLSILGLILGTILAFNGHSTVASVLFATTILGLASVFVIGKIFEAKSTKEEESSK